MLGSRFADLKHIVMRISKAVTGVTTVFILHLRNRMMPRYLHYGGVDDTNKA